MSRIWRNRALLAIGLSIGMLVVFAVQHYGFYDFKALVAPEPEEDPIVVIEKNGHVDVLYYGISEHESDLLGATPTAALGIIYYSPGLEETDANYHVRLTDTGWETVEGRYDWSPDMEEEYQDKIHLWSFEKFHWWQGRGLFKPGEYNRVHEAMYGLLDWHQDLVFRDFLYRVFIWAETSGAEWIVLEIDVVVLAPPQVMPGYSLGEGAGYVVGLRPQLRGTLVVFRARKERVFTPEGRWVEIKRYPVQEALEAGELTETAFNEMEESRQVQVVDARTPMGNRQYSKGFNHPWQGRELAQEGAT
jgi:hypothetical protein